MHHYQSQSQQAYAPAIYALGVKNQLLLSKALDMRLLHEAKLLQDIDRQLVSLLQCKRLGSSTHYIWHTQDDDKVRSAHAANDERIFSWDSPPPTGHPGEDFNCRCWAEPINTNEYADQFLIASVSDNPNKWTNQDLNNHYTNGNGTNLTLSEIGYLDDIITHYGDTLGIYNNVNKQIVERAWTQGAGSLIYEFENTYDFGSVLFSFGESTVSGVFLGEVRRESGFLVISGIITYDFFDQFADRFQTVEIIDALPTIDREEAEDLAETLFGVGSDGNVFDITDRWQTKFNATVKIESR